MFGLIMVTASVLGQLSDASSVPVTGSYPVIYNGVHFVVYGSPDPNIPGSVMWDKRYVPNVKSYWKAKNAMSSDKPDVTPNYGLEPTRMGGKGEQIIAESARAKQFYSEAQGQAGDVASRLHVTVVGSDSERKVVLDDLAKHPAFAELRPFLLVQDYAPGEWAVDPSLGFQPGTPSIIVQQGKTSTDPTGGKVVYRTADYAIGPDALAQELRKARPDYQPKRDPSPSNQAKAGCPLGFTHEMLWPTIAVSALIMFVATKPRKVQP